MQYDYVTAPSSDLYECRLVNENNETEVLYSRTVEISKWYYCVCVCVCVCVCSGVVARGRTMQNNGARNYGSPNANDFT